MSTKRIFITGTNTGAGKTYAACSLLNSLKQSGLRAIGLKPIASGAITTTQGLRSEDALALQAASSVSLSYELINPILFKEPIAPHLAAKLQKQKHTVKSLLKACGPTLKQDVDCIVIEGAGGWLVPLNEQETLADFAAALEAEIILVVGMRLGCINHSLLTVKDIEARGLKFSGWIANCLEPDMLCLEENIETLKKLIKAPLLARLNYEPSTTEL